MCRCSKGVSQTQHKTEHRSRIASIVLDFDSQGKSQDKVPSSLNTIPRLSQRASHGEFLPFSPQPPTIATAMTILPAGMIKGPHAPLRTITATSPARSHAEWSDMLLSLPIALGKQRHRLSARLSRCARHRARPRAVSILSRCQQPGQVQSPPLVGRLSRALLRNGFPIYLEQPQVRRKRTLQKISVFLTRYVRRERIQ